MNFLVTVNNQPRVPCQPVKAKDPWAAAIEVIQARSERKGISPREFEAALQLVEIQFACVAHLVYKWRWAPRHKVPYPKRVQAGAATDAAELLALCNLAIELHAVGAGPEYPNALDWFVQIAAEQRLAVLRGLLTPATNSSGKAELRRWAKAIRNGVNPVCLTRQPHTHNLVDRAIAAAKGKDSRHLFCRLVTGSQMVNGCKVLGLVQAIEASAAALNDGRAEVLYFDRECRKFVSSTPGRVKPKTALEIPLSVE